ncbi:O-acetyl-ADP-ribose deacetylase MACROD2 [Collichthys lucidus]|uniref:O-acetyl-ADP-ribose deacetylase MACROD2 n=1 Tax=Collichthys lucidus TaxID=240159 RepID=A0A4U5VBX2_COLLU|nr:O-acetyl-ADP-ribose deacetylase MACROD2 [Collichthys lucidus]
MSKKKKDWKTEKDRLLRLDLEVRRTEYRRQDFISLDKIPTWREENRSSDDEEGKEQTGGGGLTDKVSLYKGDITVLEVDAIVNAGQVFTCPPVDKELKSVQSRFGSVKEPSKASWHEECIASPWELHYGKLGLGFHSKHQLASQSQPSAVCLNTFPRLKNASHQLAPQDVDPAAQVITLRQKDSYQPGRHRLTHLQPLPLTRYSAALRNYKLSY